MNPDTAFSEGANLISLIKSPKSTRDDIVSSYAEALLANRVDWPSVNRAITERWSLSALAYIKKKAWRRLV